MNLVERIASGVVLFFMRRRMERQGFDGQRAEIFLKRAFRDLESTAADALRFDSAELSVLQPRLTRRYDIGMAMNEAANRAIEAKRVAGDKPPVQLTAKQQAALAFQQEHLQRVVDQA